MTQDGGVPVVSMVGKSGVGKTTALELVRYAIDALPSREANPTERKRIEREIAEQKQMLENTLESLTHPFYVIDAEDGKQAVGAYNPKRGAAVIAYSAEFLDRAIPLKSGSHAAPRDAAYREADAFVADARDGDKCRYLFRNNGLHIEIQVDPTHPIGREAPGNVSDVVLESAVTTIQDCEDSVAAVDADRVIRRQMPAQVNRPAHVERDRVHVRTRIGRGQRVALDQRGSQIFPQLQRVACAGHSGVTIRQQRCSPFTQQTRYLLRRYRPRRRHV